VGYDPNDAPDSSTWLRATEAERLEAVKDFHRELGEPVASLRLHAAIHVTVENQLAEGVEAALEALERLVSEGLDRHDAIHAIGSVVAEEMFAAMRDKTFDPTRYEARLRALTAAAWRGAS
jgi:hypothetical protein